MILKSTIFDKKKIFYSDLRKIEKEKFGLDIPVKIHSHVVPQLPAWTNRNYWYKGFKVNVFNCTCTCEEYFMMSAQFGDRDVRSVCRHIYYRLKYTAVSNYLDSLTLLLLDTQIQHGLEHLYKFSLDSKEYYFGFKRNTDWINVYVELNQWVRYSYSLSKERWSYGMSPDAAEKIINRLKELISDN